MEGGLPPAGTVQENDTFQEAFYLNHLNGIFLRCILHVLSSAESIKPHLPFIAFLSLQDPFEAP